MKAGSSFEPSNFSLCHNQYFCSDFTWICSTPWYNSVTTVVMYTLYVYLIYGYIPEIYLYLFSVHVFILPILLHSSVSLRNSFKPNECLLCSLISISRSSLIHLLFKNFLPGLSSHYSLSSIIYLSTYYLPTYLSINHLHSYRSPSLSNYLPIYIPTALPPSLPPSLPTYLSTFLPFSLHNYPPT